MSTDPRTLPGVPLSLVYIDPAGDEPGVWKVLHKDGTLLFEAPTESEARGRMTQLSAMCKIRMQAGRPCSGSDMLTLFPPTAPAPLVMGALSATELMREDVFDSSSQTWTMRNVEVFRSGDALKRRADGSWEKIHFVPDDTRNLVEAFAALGWTPPVKVTHGSEQAIVLEQLPTIARTVALKAAEVEDPNGVKQLGAFADLEKVPGVLRDAIRDGKLHGRSIEFWRNQIPRTDGKEGKFPLVLKAVALLGAELPAVRGMPPLDVAPEKFSSAATSSETLTQETEEPMSEPAPKAVTLSVEEYEKLKQAQEAAKVQTERLAADNEALTKRLARLEVDRRTESAVGAAARLRDSGKITPAQEQNLVEILKTLDDDKADAVTVVSLGTDGKQAETKKSQRASLISLLDSMPAHPNAPGKTATRGDRTAKTGPGDADAFEALDAGAKDAAVTRLWNKLCADAKLDPSSQAGRLLYTKALKDLRSGAAEIPSEETVR